MAEIPFTAYAGDCLVHARLELPGGRLTDYLNERDVLVLADVVVQAHDDGRFVELADLELSLGEVYAVEARGARGDAQRRIRTRAARMEIALVPYRVLGHLHAPPAADPLALMTRRKPMVPITSATIAFGLAGEAYLRDVETLIVNRRLIRSIAPTAYQPSKLDAIPVGPVDAGAKDMTGALYG